MKKLAFLGVRLGILALVVVAGLLWKAPQVVPEQVRDMVSRGGQVLGMQYYSDSSQTTSQVKTWLAEAQAKVTRFVKETTVPDIISGTQKEVVVEDVLKDLVDRVTKLPVEQAETVKQQFCQDLIDEATQSGKTK